MNDIDTSDSIHDNSLISQFHLLALGDEGGSPHEHLVAQRAQRPPVHALAITAVKGGLRDKGEVRVRISLTRSQVQGLLRNSGCLST